MAIPVNCTEYKSLFHYTTGTGLLGILNSQSLWATHYKQLNDTSEYQHGLKILYRLIKQLLIEKIGLTKKFFPDFDGSDEQAKGIAFRFVNAGLHTLDDTTLGIYITSFCKHAIGSEEYTNGLLSMWRGYGQDGGYAIEIAIEEFVDINRKAQLEYSFQGGLIEALYISNTQDNLKEALGDYYDEYVQSFEVHLNQILNPQISETAAIAGLNIFLGAITIKHPAFEEEAEYRNIVMPSRLTSGYIAFHKEHDKEHREPSRELPIHAFPKNGRLVPYVEIGGKSFGSLPIKRIIVGPHPDQKRRVESLRVYGEQFRFTVVPSEIPYIGM